MARAGAGEVQLLEGYFVHFTAPENLAPIPKHVVFVLDTSGSMRHRKMHQTIAAMVSSIIITIHIIYFKNLFPSQFFHFCNQRNFKLKVDHMTMKTKFNRC